MEGLAPNLGMAPRLTARPGLRLLSYLALLPAGTLELEATVARAVAENPFLERRAWRTCRTCGLATVAERCPACATPAWESEPVAPADWRADLLADVLPDLPRPHHGPTRLVVAALDDHGLLPLPPDLPADVLAEVVTALRAAGPPGIAASSPTDCVRVQAHALVADGEATETLAHLVDDWLPAVAEGRYADVADALGVPEPEVLAAVDLLRARTRPFVALTSPAPRSAPTDVVFVRRHGALVAHVADAAGLGLARAADDLPPGPEARAWAAPHRDAADRLLAAVTARHRMLQRVADVLADRQRDFVLHGAEAHRPVRRREVASALDVHPSTVGRAVAGKVARCPDGRVVPLAAFFGAVTSTRSRVEQALRDHPGASDAEVSAALARTGKPLARRTVAKYRANAASHPA
ncbi:hypothetical protein [Nocardioides sp.]|uniref:RNA polymerase factor sigma-54 n=1 Tax=Nocardioides sp. TaxID=35761 RepID=UPI002D7E769D|nr:hypothetical protein [Nocardioides sp.]